MSAITFTHPTVWVKPQIKNSILSIKKNAYKLHDMQNVLWVFTVSLESAEFMFMV